MQTTEHDTAEILDAFLEIAKGNLQRDGELAPVLMIDGKDGEGVCTHLLIDSSGGWNSQQVRGQFVWRLGLTLGYAYRAERFLVVSDSYVRTAPIEEGYEVPKNGLKTDPEAQECILVAAYEKDGTTSIIHSTYQKVDGEYQFGETIKMPNIEEKDTTFDAFFAAITKMEEGVKMLAEREGAEIEKAKVVARSTARKMGSTFFSVIPVGEKGDEDLS